MTSRPRPRGAEQVMSTNTISKRVLENAYSDAPDRDAVSG